MEKPQDTEGHSESINTVYIYTSPWYVHWPPRLSVTFFTLQNWKENIFFNFILKEMFLFILIIFYFVSLTLFICRFYSN